jgi:hypothetical protein
MVEKIKERFQIVFHIVGDDPILSMEQNRKRIKNKNHGKTNAISA